MGGLSKVLGRALLKSSKKGAKAATVKRPGQIALEESKKVADDELAKVAPVKSADDIQFKKEMEPELTAKELANRPEGKGGVLENKDGTFSVFSDDAQIGRTSTRAEAEAILKSDAAGLPPASAKSKRTPRKKTEEVKLREEILDPEDAVAIEARRIKSLDFDKYNTDETFQMNFDTINTTKGIKAVIADVANNNKLSIDEARRGTITHEQLRGWARDTGHSEKTVMKLMTSEKGTTYTAEEIVAARMVLHSSAARIYSLATKVYKGNATTLEALKFRRQLQFHREYQNHFMGARAEAGRTLNAFRVPTAADDVDMPRVMELIDAGAGYDTNRIAKAIALMPKDVTSVSNAARKYTQSKFWGVLNEMFVNSILSGPRTHIINMTGNLSMPWMHMTETAWAARIGRFLPGEEHVVIGEASAMLHGTLSAYQDAFTLMARTARTGIALDDVVKFEGTRRRSISGEHLLSPEQRATPLGQLTEGLLDGIKIPMKSGKELTIPGIGQTIRVPTERIMMPVDEFFKTITYRAEIERQAFRHVYDNISAGTAKMANAEAMVREFMENTPIKAIKAAEDYARYVTFQNALGPRAQSFQLAIAKTPGLKLIAPFVRTPVNIFKAGILDRSPIATLTPSFWRAMKNGGRERDMMLSRVSIGTATSAVVAKMTAEGFITGGGPRNADARRLLEMTGWQPYSFHWGNHYMSYARLEPFAFVIGAVADATEISSYINSDVETMQDEEAELNNAIAAIVMGITNNTMSKTYLRGVADFMDMATDPDRNLLSWSKSMSSALVPFSALRGQLGAIDDPGADTVTEWLRAQRNIEILYVSYNRMLEEAGPFVDRINAFLGGQLDTEAMCAVVDPDLYRQRAT